MTKIQITRAPTNFQDTTKWYEFHQDHGHRTNECHVLYLEVSNLLKQGHLKDLLSEGGRATKDKVPNREKSDMPLVPPRTDKIIHVISKGSKVNRVLYATAK